MRKGVKLDGGRWEQRWREVWSVLFFRMETHFSHPLIEKGSLKRKGRQGRSLNKVLEETEGLESRSWLESRAQVEGLVLDWSRGPSFAEHEGWRESPCINCQLSEG